MALTPAWSLPASRSTHKKSANGQTIGRQTQNVHSTEGDSEWFHYGKSNCLHPAQNSASHHCSPEASTRRQQSFRDSGRRTSKVAKTCNSKESYERWHCTLFLWGKAGCHNGATNVAGSEKLFSIPQLLVCSSSQRFETTYSGKEKWRISWQNYQSFKRNPWIDNDIEGWLSCCITQRPVCVSKTGTGNPELIEIISYRTYDSGPFASFSLMLLLQWVIFFNWID